MSALAPADRALRLAVLDHFIASGEAPSVSTLAHALGRQAGDVAKALDRLAAGRALVLRPGTHEVLMIPPFSAVPTPFRVEAERGARAWWANCIWDALGVPVVLGAAARIRTTCGDCGDLMQIEVPEPAAHGGAAGDALGGARGVIHFAVPAARWWDDIVYT